mmetsp:Transcript_100877/g.325631  ORF Transcript_100877/g.325631 Transcript_100877/m.325631 type:complete len:242 (-) Transcript_100877:503-1228(-)
MRTKDKSSVSSWTFKAGEMIQLPWNSLRSPLPKSTTPIFIASSPKYSVRYLDVRSTANFCMVLKPSSSMEPLLSRARIRSCWATQSSSPMQGWMLQACSSRRSLESHWGHLPLALIGRSTFLARIMRPPPQALEQPDHSDQSCSLQSLLHEPMLQERVSSVVSHTRPPNLAVVRIDLVLTCVPPSQSAEHRDQPDQAESLQSTGHFLWLQRLLRCNCGQGIPSALGATKTSLLRICTPPHS